MHIEINSQHIFSKMEGQRETTQILRGTIGTLTEYKIGNDWDSYKERKEQYFIANYIEDNKRVPVLLTVIGEQAYEILRGLCDPELPSNKSYTDLCKLLKEQFSKKVAIFKERIEFYDLKQYENETVKEFFVRLKNKAIECKFGAALNEVLKDRLVSGLKRGAILDRLCEEEHTASLDSLLQTAIKKEATLLSSYTHQTQVNKLKAYQKGPYKRWQPEGGVKKDETDKKTVEGKEQRKGKREWSGPAKCKSCGGGNHNFSTCKYKTYVCKVCKKVGHLAKVCYKNCNNFVESETVKSTEDEKPLDFLEMYYVNKSDSTELFKIKILINNKPITMEVDSGAGV